MREVFAQRGVPWLTPADEQALLDYLDEARRRRLTLARRWRRAG